MNISHFLVCLREVCIAIGIVISRIYLGYSLGQYVTKIKKKQHRKKFNSEIFSRLGGRFIKLVLIQICPVSFLSCVHKYGILLD